LTEEEADQAVIAQNNHDAQAAQAIQT